MSNLNFGDIDKYAQDGKFRDRIRAVIKGLLHGTQSRFYQEMLEGALANLQPIETGTNIDRLEIGAHFHWENKLRGTINSKIECALVILRQLLVDYWSYLLNYSDESLPFDDQRMGETHLETLEAYVKNGLDKFVVVGDVRQGYWLMGLGEYKAAMEDVR